MSQHSLPLTHSRPTLTASQHWEKLLSSHRLGSSYRSNASNQTATQSEPARTPFHKDYDRLIFSQSFRQLNQKTQVHPLTNQLGIHTRLTHSLEVSCIGRSLGMQAGQKLHDTLSNGLPQGVSVADVGVIVQASCLAHDIGNPPFGHAGEYAIRDWFHADARADFLAHLTPSQQLDLLGFEGNAQGFRLLTRNEHHPDAGGMRLTCATLGAFMKYPWLASHRNTLGEHSNSHGLSIQKYGCFMAEAEMLERLAHYLHLPESEDFEGFARHPLAYLLESADDICYALIDLEDGIHLGMLDYAQVEPLLLRLIGERGAPPEVTSHAPIAQRLASMRGRAMMRLVEAVSESFVQNMDVMLSGEMQGSLFDHCEADIMDGINEAKTVAKREIFGHASKVRLELMANRCLQTLLDAFMPLATLPLSDASPNFEQGHLLRLLDGYLTSVGRELDTDVYANALNILDFITGMNDHEAYRLAQELNGNIGGVGGGMV